MKIIQINSVYGYGSTGRLVEILHTSLSEKGFESFVFYGRGKESEDIKVIKFSNLFSNFVDILLTRIFNRHGEGNILSTYRLIKEIKIIKPDIIHLHNIHGYYINYKILFDFLKKSQISVIWLLHDRWPISGSSALFDEKKINWEKPSDIELKKISKNYPKYLYLNSRSAKRNYRKKKEIFKINNLTLVTPSKWLKKVCENSYFKDTKIKIINNGIDLEVFKPANYDNNKRKKLLGVASHWDKNKGLDYFNQLATDLDNEYEITLVGTNESVIKSIHPRINCINRTESIDELIKLYSNADIFINPTLDDNFPTVNLEAQACGTPVITFDTGGSGESVTKDTGRIVEKGNYDKLKEQIVKWPSKSEKIILNCTRNAQNYSMDVMIKKYIDLYLNDFI